MNAKPELSTKTKPKPTLLVCAYHCVCTILIIYSYPPDNCDSSDDVYETAEETGHYTR